MKYTKQFDRYWSRVAPTQLGEWRQFDRDALKCVAFKAWQAARRGRI